MKFIKKKSFIISCLVCLMPILLGVTLWNRLPDIMAIHFNIHNEADNFATKSFAVFGLPILMMFLQIFCCIINDVNSTKHGERKKFEIIVKSIIPILTIILQVLTIGYAFGINLDIRRIVAAIVGITLIVIGNYQPKLDYIKDYDKVSTEKARKINRFIGFATVIMGAIFILSIFLPPIATVISLFLLIPYALICVIYGIKIGSKKDECNNNQSNEMK